MAAVEARAQFSDLPKVISTSLDKVYAALRADNHGPLGNHVVFYFPFDGGAGFDLRIGVQLARAFTTSGEVMPFETPAGAAAHVTHLGDYGQMKSAHDAIHQWVSAQGRKLTGASWEVYGDWSDDPAQLRTDIFYQLKVDTGG